MQTMMDTLNAILMATMKDGIVVNTNLMTTMNNDLLSTVKASMMTTLNTNLNAEDDDQPVARGCFQILNL